MVDYAAAAADDDADADADYGDGNDDDDDDGSDAYEANHNDSQHQAIPGFPGHASTAMISSVTFSTCKPHHLQHLSPLSVQQHSNCPTTLHDLYTSYRPRQYQQQQWHRHYHDRHQHWHQHWRLFEPSSKLNSMQTLGSAR